MPLDPVPVRVDVDARLRGALVAHLEGTLGWQVTDGEGFPPALRLIGVGAAVPAPQPVAEDVPTLLLVRDDDPVHATALAAQHAHAVVRWPDERERLPELAVRLQVHRSGPAAAAVAVAGAAGGVGTTTVALALGGLLAWRGHATLVVATGDVPVPDVARVSSAALAGHRVWEAASPVAGVAGLRVIAATPGGHRPAVATPRAVVALVDRGGTGDGDVLVARRDRAGVAAVAASAAAAVVIVDAGPVPLRGLRDAVAGRPYVVVPWSTRVARAGLLQRVPASLPGTWLRLLEPMAASIR